MKPETIIIHHSASSRDKTTLADIDAWHKARWPGFISSLGWHIGYHFIILGNGQVHQTRREDELGAHSIPNDGKIGVCLTGEFETEKPSDAQLISLGLLLGEIKKRYGWGDERILGHNQKNQTLCPGKNLNTWLGYYRQISFYTKLVEYYNKLVMKLLR